MTSTRGVPTLEKVRQLWKKKTHHLEGLFSSRSSLTVPLNKTYYHHRWHMVELAHWISTPSILSTPYHLHHLHLLRPPFFILRSRRLRLGRDARALAFSAVSTLPGSRSEAAGRNPLGCHVRVTAGVFRHMDEVRS